MNNDTTKRNNTTTDWVMCPICGESDMRREVDTYGNALIHCVNHNCGSNGGDNYCGLENRLGLDLDARLEPSVPVHLSHADCAVMAGQQPDTAFDTTCISGGESEEGYSGPSTIDPEDMPPLPRPLAYGFLPTQMYQYGGECIALYNRQREGDMMSPEWKGGYSAGFEAAKQLFGKP